MALSILMKDVLTNLDVVAHIDHHQTLAVAGDKLYFENRSFPFLWRTVTGDGRHYILAAITKCFDLADSIVANYSTHMYLNPSQHVHGDQVDIMMQHLSDLRERKETLLTGLSNLATFERYKNDSLFQLEMENFKKRTRALAQRCNQVINEAQNRIRKVETNQQLPCCHHICMEPDPNNDLGRDLVTM